MNLKLKLGTRRSLLAWAQSSWVAREVERLNPGVSVELVGIETRGDRIQDVSLRSVAGKEFFVAELDEALSSGKVDFTVHSMKDLSLERPESFVCAAIPVRENPRDVILFGPQALNHLKEGKPIKIGTSSPRRLENIPGFLKKALPHWNQTKSEIQFVEIRGNVNTRLSRVHESTNSTKYLDAVVLAFAGIQRLWNDSIGNVELQKLLAGVRWMILPLRECPTAPGQGALAVECRAKDSEISKILSKIHHEETALKVQAERKILEDCGGGCHQRFGATAIQVQSIENLLFIRGAKLNGDHLEEVRWQMPKRPEISKQALKGWDGSLWRGNEKTHLNSLPEIKNEAAFVAHSRAIPDGYEDRFSSTRVWTSGVSSWFKLAAKGIWVEGCAEGLGFETLLSTITSEPLGLPSLNQWIILTHLAAIDDWKKYGVLVLPTYEINLNCYKNEAKKELEQATHVFWSSGSQFNELKEYVSTQVHHACGPGKTAARLKAAGVNPWVFPSVKEWREWLRVD